jgi:uncharacterized protein YabE (DUF348 family)
VRARIVHGAVLAALTATGVAWVSSGKSVTVEIDGQSQVVQTHASTVAEVLDRAGVRLDAHDVLAPAANRNVTDGSHIVIKRGRLVTVRINDLERGVWVNASNVDQVLTEIGVAADERTYVSASRSSRVPSSGPFRLQVRTPAEVRLVTETLKRTVVTTAPTVAEFLAMQGVVLTDHDDVNVPLTSYPAEGTTVLVRDTRGVRIARTRPIPFKTRQIIDPAIPAGTLKLRAPGARGVLVLYFRQQSQSGRMITTADGSRIARAPRDRIVVAGGRTAVAQPAAAAKPKAVVVVKRKPPAVTKKPPSRRAAEKPIATSRPKKGPSHKPAADKLNWRALASCESGNNPRAVSSGGTYRGLYQFMLDTWRGVGGVGDPINATRDEQTYRAQILYRRAGAGAWGSCGSRLYR